MIYYIILLYNIKYYITLHYILFYFHVWIFNICLHLLYVFVFMCIYV